jgi:hypothetical protein
MQLSRRPLVPVLVRPATKAAGAVTGALVLTGLLATPALGDDCIEAVEWEGVQYVAHRAPHGAPDRGARLGEGEIPNCPVSGRCAPPAEKVAVFALDGIEPAVAVAARDAIYLRPGTFPALPDHPLHEAIFGSPARPSYREPCGEPFRFSGEVTIATSTLRVGVAEPVPGQLELFTDEPEIWVDLDVETRVEGFDRNGVATIDVGDEVEITGRICEGEAWGLLADRIQPAEA